MYRFRPFIPGGHPIKVDDLAFMTSAYEQLAGFVCKHLASNDSTPRILYGCVITGTAPSRSITAGAVWWNNEIWRVIGGSIPGSGTYVVGVPETNVVAPSPVTYGNGSVYNVHTESLFSMNSTNIQGIITSCYFDDAVKLGAPQWTTASTSGTLAWASTDYTHASTAGLGAFADVACRLLPNGTVEIEGSFTNTVAAPGSNQIFTLPAACRPQKTRRVQVLRGSTVVGLTIFSNGECYLDSVATTLHTIHSLDGIKFDVG
jgi:hypothetical protein